MAAHSHGGSSEDGTASSPDVTMSKAICTSCPTLFYMLLVGSVMMMITHTHTHSHTDAGRGAPTYTHSELMHTQMEIYTDMYSYLHVSSLNFKLVRFVDSVSPIFPF